MAVKKKKHFNFAAATWILLAVIFAVFAIMLMKFPVTPLMWRIGIIGCIAVVVALLGFLSLRRTKKRKPRPFTSFMNILLSVVLAAGSWFFPHLEKRVDEVFTPVGEIITTTVNVYALTTDYKTAHIDVFKGTNNVITSTNLQDYKNSIFITQTSVDQENQANAIAFINKELDTTISEKQCTTVWDATAALYAGEGAALVLNEGYVDTLVETETYANFKEDTIILRSITIEMEAAAMKGDVEIGQEASTEHSFGIYFGGSDSRDSALSIYTRTDVNIAAAVDPVNKQILLISIPRDLYVENPYLNNGYDKLTHLGNSGIQNTVAGFNQMLDANIGNYVVVNFATYTAIINALGGIDVYNPYAFSSGKNYFAEGNIHIDGEEALSYVRERYALSDGDYGRNEHQTIVLKAILHKILSKDTITRFDSLLGALSGTFATNITTDQIYALVNQQISSMTSWSIISYHVDAWGEYGETASMPGQALFINHPYQNQLEFIKGEYDKIMAGEIITQQTIPGGY